MQLTMHLKKRWITSVLREAETTQVALPWQRGKRRKPVAIAHTISRSGSKMARA